MLEKFSISTENAANSSEAWRQGRDWESIQIKSAQAVRRSVADLGKHIFNNPEFKRARLLIHWQEILGKSLGANSSPGYIKNRVLFITCASPACSQEITLLQKTILDRINAYLPEEQQINKIVCKIGDIAKPIADGQRTATPWPKASLTEEERQKVQKLEKACSDPEIGRAIGSLYSQSLIRSHQLQLLGAVRCARCGRLSFSGSPCWSCRRTEREKQRIEVLRTLNDKPWTSYAELCSSIPSLDHHDYIVYRLWLASSWRESIRISLEGVLVDGTPKLPKGTPLPKVLKVRMIKLAALQTSKQYASLTEGDVLYALRPKYGKALLSGIAPGPSPKIRKDK